ncbi:hypothetical protein CP082626L3_1118B, partial [Chlamydia psittaci 08-2626_L3]
CIGKMILRENKNHLFPIKPASSSCFSEIPFSRIA